MTSTDAYIYVIIGILGVAYPVLLQVVARLDEKYESDHIVELFNKEWENKAFRYSLISSIFFLALWSLELPAIIRIDEFDSLIENSAALLIAISCVLLIVFFFFFVNKILVYYTPSKFILYLIAKHDLSKNPSLYFKSLSELLLLFIKRQQKSYSKTLSDFFYLAFKKIREEQTTQPIIYPELYYEVVYKAIEELAILKQKRNYLLEHRTSGGIWLLGEGDGAEISQHTYSWMWQNLLLAIRYEQDDLIVNHWQTCHQHYIYKLTSIHPDYRRIEERTEIKNKEAVDKRHTERQTFLTFHYVLGGLLIYKKRYSCIKRLFSYTQSYPPKYELLPESMYEIFKFYFNVRDPYDRNYTWISNIYPFPELSGVNADYVVKKWVMSYMAVLFLRQYTIIPYLVTMRPLDFPKMPSIQGEIREWIDGLDFFMKLVSEHMKDRKMLKTLGLDFITREWCEENNKPFPISFIEDFKRNLESQYNKNAVDLPISEDKVSILKNSSLEIIESAIQHFEPLNNKNEISDDDSDRWYVHGQQMLQNKDSFFEHSESDNINFDSILATVIVKDFEEGLSETLLYKRTKSYLLKSEDLFRALDRIGLNEDIVILNFGVNLEYLSSSLKTKEFSNGKYRNVDIYQFERSHRVSDSLFILRKSDLPNITTMDIDQETITKYSLSRISNHIKLFLSLIDLNQTSAEVYNENKMNRTDDELRKSVLISIFITLQIKWKKSIELIQFEEYSDYFQTGIINKLEDVKPIPTYIE